MDINESPQQTTPNEEFLEKSSDLLTTTIASILEKRGNEAKYIMKDIAEEGIGEYIEREKSFMVAILEGYERWSQEPNNIVLWDVDDTLGKTVFDNKGNSEWFFRPAIQVLIPYLKNHYPDIKNGFLTTRTKDRIDEDFSKYADLLKEYPFFDPNLTFCTSDIKIDYEDEKILFNKLQKVEPRVDSGTIYKYTIWEDLKSKNPNNRYRIIDDNAIAKIVGNDGIYVEKLMPMIS